MPETAKPPVPRAEISHSPIEQLYANVAEKTFYQSAYYDDSYRQPYNPDDLFRKDYGYKVYREMLKDDQVSVCLQLKKDLVIGSGFDIISEDKGESVKEDIQKALYEDPEYSFDEMLYEILSSYEFGFSVSEKIFKHRSDGTLTLKYIKTRHPSTWLLHVDDGGNVEKFEQQGGKTKVELDPKCLIHYVNNRSFQNPYGTSDLRAAYYAWFTKTQVIRYYGMFLEKSIGPIPVAKYPMGTPQAQVDQLYDAVRSFQSKTALTIPKEVEIEFLNSGNDGDAYVKAINLFNMFIGRSLFVPDLVGLQGSETSGGSQALGKEQLDLFLKHISRRRALLERVINREIIQPIVQYNHGFVDVYPKFQFRPVQEDDQLSFSKLWLEASRSGAIPVSEQEIQHFKKSIKFPHNTVTEEDLAIGDNPNTGKPQEEQDNVEQAEPPEKDSSAKKDEPVKKKEFSLEPRTSYEKKVNFAEIKFALDSADLNVMTDTKPIFEKIAYDVIDQIERKKILDKQKIDMVDGIKINHLKDLKLALKKTFREVFLRGKSEARTEVNKKDMAKPLASDKFLEMLEKETFSFVGDWQYDISKRVRQTLIAAIKDGRPLSDVTEEILQTITGESNKTRIERFARTKHTEIYNKGRLEYFKDSGVVAAYQYSAILDDRTSDICADLDGKIFSDGSEPVPPLHFYCRSTLVPITKYEDFTPDRTVETTDENGNDIKQDINAYIRDNIGDGFSVK